MATNGYEDKIFLIEVEKIKPNPFQPRHEFNEERLRDLADSIKQYGVLQPLVVTRNEITRDDGSLYTEYEIIAGERRWRAARIAGLSQVPAVIRTGEQSDKEKLELAIIENLQREDLNPIDRAQAFFKLANEFGLEGERGEGLLRALMLGKDVGPKLVELARDRAPEGLLINSPRPNLLRFMPALNIADEEIVQMCNMLRELLKQV